jgi:hypothetical protein
MDKFNATITFDIKTVDGKKFCDCTLNYYDMGYPAMALVEGAFINALVELNNVAKERAAA